MQVQFKLLVFNEKEVKTVDALLSNLRANLFMSDPVIS